MTYDLIVIGAGPAGCAAAITAARTGASVLLIERGHFPRHKVCGEFVSAESLKLLEHLLPPDLRPLIHDSPRISQARIFVDGAQIQAEISPPAASIARFDLDMALWNSCRSAGVSLLENCAAQKVEQLAQCPSEKVFKVSCGSDVFESRALINAAGRWSFLTSPATRERAAENRWIGLKAHFREPSPSHSVDLYFFEGGYCGVQPVKLQNGVSVINACAMVRADIATNLQQVLECHPKLGSRSTSWQPVIDQVSTSPLVFHNPEPVSHGILQVGDAATFIDPFVGDGISLALQGGALAAECLASFFRNECNLRQAADRYAQEYARRLSPVFRASSRLRNLMRWPKFLRKPVMTAFEHSPALARQLVKLTR